MRISARNQWKGAVTELKQGNVMTEVTVQVGDLQVVSAVTRASAELLGLQVGTPVMVIVKATEVLLATPD